MTENPTSHDRMKNRTGSSVYSISRKYYGILNIKKSELRKIFTVEIDYGWTAYKVSNRLI